MPLCQPPDPPTCVAAAGSSPAPLATPLDAVGSHLADAFGGTSLLWYAGAVGGSAALAYSGADQSIRDEVQRHFGAPAYGTAASFAGYVLPAVVAPGVWLTGLVLRDRDAAAAGSAAVQAYVFAALATGLLKVSVGRAYPPEGAHTFTPFQNVSWPFAAWPSGHTSSAMAVVGALTGYYGGDALWVPLVGYPLTLVVAGGLLAGDEHWTSDLLAGAVLGQCVGWSIGRAFRDRTRGEAPPKVSVVPLFHPSAQGVAIAGYW